MLRWALRFILFAVLTLLTQVGGLAYAAAWTQKRSWRRLAVFGAGYLLLTFAIVPPLAGLAGRERLPCLEGSEGLAPNPLVCLLNRGYLEPTTIAALQKVGAAVAARFPGSRVTPLEAGFPFFLPGFPMLPHISHRDGRTVDLAFFYRSRESGAAIAEGSPSPIGYFVVEQPRPGDPAPCGTGLTWTRWSFWWIEPEERDWMLDEERTAVLARRLADEPAVRRLLLEPHLKERLSIGSSRVRSASCGAARHDDHMHVSFEATR